VGPAAVVGSADPVPAGVVRVEWRFVKCRRVVVVSGGRSEVDMGTRVVSVGRSVDVNCRRVVVVSVGRSLDVKALVVISVGRSVDVNMRLVVVSVGRSDVDNKTRVVSAGRSVVVTGCLVGSP